MSNDNDVLNSMVDTIELFLQEASSADKSTQCQLFLQTDSFFRKVMAIQQESEEFPRLLKCIHSFFQSLNLILSLFLIDKNKFKSLSDLITFFIDSPIASQISNDLSTFTISFLLMNDLNEENSSCFHPFLHKFFTSPTFAVPFEKESGLNCLWKLLMDPSKVNLFEIVFSDLQQTIHLYFQTKDSEKTNDFFSTVIETTKDIPLSNATKAFQFIHDLISASQANILLPFISQGGFTSFNQYIIDHNDPSLLVLYHIFMSLCTSPKALPEFPDEVHPIIGELIKLFEFTEISETFQKSAMKILLKSLTLFSKEYCPIQPESLYIVASSIKPEQKESALILFQISHYLVTNFDFDIILTIPLFFPFYDYNFFVENDVSQLFEVLKIAEDSFLPFVPLFFTSITKNITSKQFFDLITKYPILLEFLNIYANDNIFTDHLLTLFYSISPLFKERKMYSKVLIKLLVEEEKVDFLFKYLTTKDSIFADSILNEIAKLFCYSKKLRNSPHSTLFLNKINYEQVSSYTIFNVIIGLSGKFYNPKFDTFLLSFMKKHDFFNMTKEDIKKLAFGVFINKLESKKSNIPGHLIFPSLLPFCGDDFKIVYPFDKWICGQYGIDIWLNETGQTIDKFPSISNIANRYLLPKHVKMILEHPNLISKCCNNSFQMNHTFEFANKLPNTMISFPLTDSVRSVSFWFSINTLPKYRLRIVNFFNCNLIIKDNLMSLNDCNSYNIAVNHWYHIVITINDKQTICTCYVNGKQSLQCNITTAHDSKYAKFDLDYDEAFINNNLKNKKSNNLRFGSASINPIQWYIGGAIRVYSQIIQNDLIESLFTSGVCNIVKNNKPAETLFITAENFVEPFEDLNQKVSSRYLSENSRPSISFSFLQHLQNAYNGGQCILDIIKKRIEQDDDESIKYLIESLCKMQNLEFTNWKLNTFAVHMSTLFYLRPLIFNEDVLSTIFKCFSSDMNDIINWEDILVFIFDFGLFNTANRSFLILKLSEYCAQYNFDENIKSCLLNFIFNILLFFDKELKDSEYDILLSLINKFNPSNSQISYILQSSLDYSNNLINPSFRYKKNLFEGRIYKSLYEMFINSIDDKFCDYHLIFVLQPNHSIELITKILKMNSKKKIPPNYINQMILFCLSHSEIKESWLILLNLLLTVKNKKIAGQFIESLETLITNSQIDSESLFLLIITLSFLSIIVLNQPENELKAQNNYWMNLWAFLYSFTFSNASMFNSEVLSSKKIISAFIQLLSLGFYTQEKVVFPFCRSLDNPDEILQFSIKPLQPFPNKPSSNLIRANFVYKPKIGNDILNSITRIIPSSHQLPPPYSEISISSHKKLYDINFVNQVLEENKFDVCDNWHEFIPEANYSIEAAYNSPIFKDIINLIVKICSGLKLVDPKSNLKRSSSNESLSLIESSLTNSSFSMIDSSSSFITNLNDEDDEIGQSESTPEVPNTNTSNITMDFNRFFLNIVTLVESISPKYSMKVISKLTIEILNYLISKKKIGLFIIRYVCHRLISGWFEAQYILDIISNILSIPLKGKEKVMKYILEILIFESKNIPNENFVDFLKLFITNSDKIFIQNNFEYDWFVILLFELLYTNKSNQEYSEQITKISKLLGDSLKSSRKKIKDKNALQIRDSVISALSELSNASKREKYEIDEFLSNLILEKKNEFLLIITKLITESLKQDILHRNAQTMFFYQNMNEFLESFDNFDVCARSISSIARFDNRRLLLFNLNYFLRLREKVLTSFPFADSTAFKNKAVTKTVSLLNDPINPSRRFERSPIIYKIPPFPSVAKNVVSVMPYPLPEYQDILTTLPKCLYDLLSINYQSFEVMVLHEFKPYILSFSYHFEVDDALLLATVLNFVTKEKTPRLKFLGDASILYGIAPLKGVLIMDSKNVYFIEGLKMTNEGCSFKYNINNEMNDIIYEFYISYIVSGYFGQPYMFFGHPLMQIPMSQLLLSTPHLWLQKEVALELNFLLGWTFIIVAKNNEDFISLSKSINEFVDHNTSRFHYYNKYPSPMNNSRLLHQSIRDVSKLWIDGHISNNTYLLYLNKISGRSYVDFSQFNVFPWIISDYSTSLYESIPEESFRDLSLPMGQIGPERTPRFQLFFETSKYFYGTHYMHLGVVLFYLFRIDPFCLFSLYFHHGWDHPSRLFSDFTEAWLSAAHVSQNDVKEIVPQLLKCPEFLTNISHLPLSESSSSNENSSNQPQQQSTASHNVENVKIGRWSTNPRDFSRIVSSELESDRVSKTLNNWIDLIFGFKSRGEAAIEAKNIFPPLCYSDNNTNTNSNANSNQTDERNQIEEEVERKANEASIINFGQCPRQIFKGPHPVKAKFNQRPHLLSDERCVLYQNLNCSTFISYALPANDLFIGSTNIFIAPRKGIVLNSTTTIMFSHELSSIIAYSNDIYNSISVAKAKAKAKMKNSAKGNSKLKDDTETDDSDDDDSVLIKLSTNSPSSLPNIKSVISLQSEEPYFLESSVSSSYQDFSNLVANIDNSNQPSLLTLTDSENISLQSLSSQNQSESTQQSLSLLDFGSNMRMKVLFKCPSSVSHIVKSMDGSLIALFLKEGSFSVYSLSYEKGDVKTGVKLMRFSTSSSEVLAAAISPVHFIAVVVCNDEEKGQRIIRYDLGLMLELDPIDTGFTVRKIAIDDHAATIIACGDEEIAIYTVSGDLISHRKIIEEIHPNSSSQQQQKQEEVTTETTTTTIVTSTLAQSTSTMVTSLAVANLEDHIKNRFFVTGHEDGFVRFWCLDLSRNEIVLMKEFRVCSTKIDLVCVASDDDNSFEVTGNALRAVAISSHPPSKMFSFEFFGTTAKKLRKEYAIRCAVCGKRFNEIKQKPCVCSSCNRFFCRDCVHKPEKRTLISNEMCKNCFDIKNKLIDNANEDHV